MNRLYMVRHGRAAAGFADSMDPGLDELGRMQAESVAGQLSSLDPMALVTSPLARARQTAMPLARMWKREPQIEPRVGEIPSPPGMRLEDRTDWLRTLMHASWPGSGTELLSWREALIAALLAQTRDTVIFSHFLAINAAMGAAMGDDRIRLFSPDNCSVTVFEVTNGTLQLAEKGREFSGTRIR
jgi:broad specificity phosphatase PhoE